MFWNISLNDIKLTILKNCTVNVFKNKALLIMIGNTIKVIIITITLMNLVLNEKLKVVVITLHHKFHLL